MKLQYKIALLFATTTLLIVLVVSSAEYYFTTRNAFEDFYKRLEIRAVVASKARQEKGDAARYTYEELRAKHLESLANEREYIIAIANGKPANTDAALKKLDSDFFDQAMNNGIARFRDNRTFYLAYRFEENGQPQLVIISAEHEFIDGYLGYLRATILVSIAATALLALFVGLWFSRIILHPVRLLNRKMQNITATQLHQRLQVSGKDEISMLSDTFNNMLDRLEATFETHKNFISNASHELNTPLTAIIGESEYMLNKQRTEEEYKTALTAILFEAERLRKITQSLLQLAQTGYNGSNQEFVPVSLDEIVYGVKETVDNIVPENKVFINLNLMPEDHGKLEIMGNQPLLELAFANIIVNACKYSNNQPVSVTMAATDHKVMLFVEDKGIGIPAEEMPYIYDPFFRASNTTRFNGYGIGLPLARNIIRMHRGTLDVSSEENVGTKIRISFPLASTVVKEA